MSSPTTTEDLLDLKLLARVGERTVARQRVFRHSKAKRPMRWAAATGDRDVRPRSRSAVAHESRGAADRHETGPAPDETTAPGRRREPRAARRRRPIAPPARRRFAFLPHAPALQQRRSRRSNPGLGRLFGFRAGPPLSRKTGALRCAADSDAGDAALSTGRTAPVSSDRRHSRTARSPRAGMISTRSRSPRANRSRAILPMSRAAG